MITQELLLQTFSYKDGSLYYKDGFDNQVNKGDLAGSKGSNGYLQVKVSRKSYLAHRVIFLMVKGFLPGYVDHIDGNKLNNKIENLRECTFSQNRCNTTRYKNNKSGVKGVFWDKEHRKWNARIQFNNKRTLVGRYSSIEDAKNAIIEKRNEIHGEFANNN